MIEVLVSDEIIDYAIEMTRRYKDTKWENSIASGEGTFSGFIGKKLVSQYLKTDLHINPSFDMICRSHRVKVKSKRTTVTPSKNYAVDVEATCAHQSCDWYVFVRVIERPPIKAWILGYFPRLEFLTTAKYYRKGDVVNSNQFIIKANCYEMVISDLRDFKNLLSTGMQKTLDGVYK